LIRTLCRGISYVAKSVKSREGGGRYGRRFLKREVGWLLRQLISFGAYVLGARAVALAEHLIARLEVLHIVAYRLDLSCDVESRNTVLWFEQASNHADGERSPSHGEAVANVEARCVNAYEHLIVANDRLVDVLELQKVE